jgi:uncharacterized phage protein (TIGR01671 family)
MGTRYGRRPAMNREILFRGKRVDNGEFIEGCYFKRWTGARYKHYIIDGLIEYEVIPETVGQFTGIYDKNGNKIFDGDVVLATLRDFNIVNEKCRVIFHNGSFGVQYGFSTDYFKSFAAWDEIEVIGNIHDNPELCAEINSFRWLPEP